MRAAGDRSRATPPRSSLQLLATPPVRLGLRATAPAATGPRSAGSAGHWWPRIVGDHLAGVGSPVGLRIPHVDLGLVTLAAVVGTAPSPPYRLCCALAATSLDAAHPSGRAPPGASALAPVSRSSTGSDRPVAFAPPLVAATFAMAVLVVSHPCPPPPLSALGDLVLVGTVAGIFDAHLVPLGTLGAASLGVSVGRAPRLRLGNPGRRSDRRRGRSLPPQLGVAAGESVARPDHSGVGCDTVLGHRRRRSTSSTSTSSAVTPPRARLLARVWRFIWVRRSTLDLRLRRTTT